MPKRSSNKNDENEIAASIVHQIAEISIKHPGKNPMAVLLGKRGGLIGGNARRDKLSPEERKRIASNAAKKRWKGHKKKKKS